MGVWKVRVCWGVMVLMEWMVWWENIFVVDFVGLRGRRVEEGGRWNWWWIVRFSRSDLGSCEVWFLLWVRFGNFVGCCLSIEVLIFLGILVILIYILSG